MRRALDHAEKVFAKADQHVVVCFHPTARHRRSLKAKLKYDGYVVETERRIFYKGIFNRYSMVVRYQYNDDAYTLRSTLLTDNARIPAWRGCSMQRWIPFDQMDEASQEAIAHHEGQVAALVTVVIALTSGGMTDCLKSMAVSKALGAIAKAVLDNPSEAAMLREFLQQILEREGMSATKILNAGLHEELAENLEDDGHENMARLVRNRSFVTCVARKAGI